MAFLPMHIFRGEVPSSTRAKSNVATFPPKRLGAPSCHIEHRLPWSTSSPGNFIVVHIPKLLWRRNPTSFCNIFARMVASREFCHVLNLKGLIWTSNGMFGTWMRDQGLISSQFGEVNDIDIFTASARWLCMCMIYPHFFLKLGLVCFFTISETFFATTGRRPLFGILSRSSNLWSNIKFGSTLSSDKPTYYFGFTTWNPYLYGSIQ